MLRKYHISGLDLMQCSFRKKKNENTSYRRNFFIESTFANEETLDTVQKVMYENFNIVRSENFN